MASGHASRTRRPHTWLRRPDCDVQKVLANKAPFHTWHKADPYGIALGRVKSVCYWGSLGRLNGKPSGRSL